MILDILLTLIACFLFLYIFWVRLREDYTANQIFTATFYVLLGIGFGNILADNFFPPWWFWATFFGGILGLAIGIWRFSLRIFEAMEAYIISGLALLFVVSTEDFVRKYSQSSLMLLISVLFFIVLFIFFDKHYKKFTWYKSGRVGFTGLTVLGLFFLARSVVAMTDVSMLSLGGDLEVILSGVTSFVGFITVYNLSEKS